MTDHTTEQQDASSAQLKKSFRLLGFNGTYWMCNAIEMWERLAYNTLRTVAAIYVMQADEPGGLHLTGEDKGWIFLWWFIFQSLFPMVTGGFADRYGYRKTILFSVVVNMTGYVLMAMYHSYWGFFGGVLVLAFGTAFFKPGLQGTLAHQLTKANSSLGWGTFYWVVNVGSFIGPVAATLILAKHSAADWRYLFLACAAFTSLNLCMLIGLPHVESGAPKHENPFQVFFRAIENLANLRLIAWDAVGLSDTLYSQRHAIVIAYPKLVTAPNPINSIFWRSPSLTFRFDQILDTTLHAGSAFQVSALFTTNLQMGATYSEDLRSITMGFEQPLVSADTVTISLIADSIANLYGYQFDGNANGIPEGSPTDDITYTYSVLPYADFDSSQTIDFDDLTRFTTAWYAKDYALELGPSSGTVPHLLMAPDTTFNGRDLITFIRMWDWYTEFAAPLGKVIADLTGPTPQLAMEGEELVISLDLAKDVTAVHVQLTYPKDRVEVDWVALDSTSFGTRLLRRWPEQGIIEADYAFPQGEVENFTISALVSINGRDPVTLEVYAEVVAKGGIRFGGAERTIEAKPVPKQFALHNNYPNPFNPRTTILFDVPTSTNATLIVYDLTGREVVRLVDGLVDAGYHQKIWDGLSSRGRKVASGIYIARLSTPRYSKSVKMLLLK